MSDFFPDPPDAPIEPEEAPQPVWLNPPGDQLPGVVPVELIIGRSDQAIMMLTGLRAFPTGVAMTLLVRTRTRMRRFDLNDEVFDGPYRHDQDDEWRRVPLPRRDQIAHRVRRRSSWHARPLTGRELFRI